MTPKERLARITDELPEDSTAHLRWIKNVWTEEGVEPGAIGQGYGIIRTSAFFVFALLEKARGN